MSDLIRYQLGEGEVAVFEFNEKNTKLKRASNNTEDPLEADETFSSVLSQIKPFANAVFNTLQSINRPDEITLGFGVKVGAKAGIVFTSVNSEANFTLSLKWTNNKQSNDTDESAKSINREISQQEDSGE